MRGRFQRHTFLNLSPFEQVVCGIFAALHDDLHFRGLPEFPPGHLSQTSRLFPSTLLRCIWVKGRCQLNLSAISSWKVRFQAGSENVSGGGPERKRLRSGNQAWMPGSLWLSSRQSAFLYHRRYGSWHLAHTSFKEQLMYQDLICILFNYLAWIPM